MEFIRTIFVGCLLKNGLSKNAIPSKDKLFRFVCLLLGIACLSACKMNQSFPTKYEVKLAQKRWTGSSRQSLLEGSDLYVNNCGRCHEYYAPKAYSEEEWTDILHKMARKSHLEETQEETLRRYVLTKMTADNAKPAAH